MLTVVLPAASGSNATPPAATVLGERDVSGGIYTLTAWAVEELVVNCAVA